MDSERPKRLQSILFLTIGAFPQAVASELVKQMSRKVSVACRLGSPPIKGDMPLLPDREQIDADELLKRLEMRYVENDTLLVGMTMRDLGVKIFTFVFGQARRNGFAALVSLARLRPEFYGLPSNPELTGRRSVAEILHELGHILGLMHCTDFDCVMHFATNVETIDLRGDDFCLKCAATLPPGFLLQDQRGQFTNDV